MNIRLIAIIEGVKFLHCKNLQLLKVSQINKH